MGPGNWTRCPSEKIMGLYSWRRGAVSRQAASGERRRGPVVGLVHDVRRSVLSSCIQAALTKSAKALPFAAWIIITPKSMARGNR